MSEYWKSTPKYWCKHCKTYVRDTKLERANHDATPRHQGNIKRFVRDLHKGQEKDQREKERAKSEIARLNGIVSGSAAGSSGPSLSGSAKAPGLSVPKQAQATTSRKEQLAQLVDLGVSIPDEFRKELAMEGEWQVVSQRVIDPMEEKKPEAIGIGVRKRPAAGEGEDEEHDVKDSKRKRWEATHRTHMTENEDEDLDALLSKSLGKGKASDKQSIKTENIKPADDENEDFIQSKGQPNIDAANDPLLKKEPSSDEEVKFPAAIDEAGTQPEGAVVFKKRAKKNIRQK